MSDGWGVNCYDFLFLGRCMYLPKCPRSGLHARITYRVPLTAVELTLQQHYLTIWHLGKNDEFRNMLFHKTALQHRKLLLNSFLTPLNMGKFSPGGFSRGTKVGLVEKDGYGEG